MLRMSAYLNFASVIALAFSANSAAENFVANPEVSLETEIVFRAAANQAAHMRVANHRVGQLLERIYELENQGLREESAELKDAFIQSTTNSSIDARFTLPRLYELLNDIASIPTASHALEMYLHDQESFALEILSSMITPPYRLINQRDICSISEVIILLSVQSVFQTSITTPDADRFIGNARNECDTDSFYTNYTIFNYNRYIKLEQIDSQSIEDILRLADRIEYRIFAYYDIAEENYYSGRFDSAMRAARAGLQLCEGYSSNLSDADHSLIEYICFMTRLVHDVIIWEWEDSTNIENIIYNLERAVDYINEHEIFNIISYRTLFHTYLTARTIFTLSNIDQARLVSDRAFEIITGAGPGGMESVLSPRDRFIFYNQFVIGYERIDIEIAIQYYNLSLSEALYIVNFDPDSKFNRLSLISVCSAYTYLQTKDESIIVPSICLGLAERELTWLTSEDFSPTHMVRIYHICDGNRVVSMLNGDRNLAARFLSCMDQLSDRLLNTNDRYWLYIFLRGDYFHDFGRYNYMYQNYNMTRENFLAASAHYEAAADIMPNVELFYSRRVASLAHAGTSLHPDNPRGALQELRGLLRDLQNDPSPFSLQAQAYVHFHIGRVHSLSGDERTARGLYEEALALMQRDGRRDQYDFLESRLSSALSRR